MNVRVEAVLAQGGRPRNAPAGEGFACTGDETLRAVCARAPWLGERLAGAAYPHLGPLLERGDRTSLRWRGS